tara:strand:+ start:1256 stop:1660 length:405 start_codon:yes stop_codon:yes gene_type:complete
MKNRLKILLISIFSVTSGQNENFNLINDWIFESMTTITRAEREEITILYNDENNLETLSFEESGAIKYNVMNEGIEKIGTGVWYSEGLYLTIVVDLDTTYGTFQIEDGVLSIIVSEEESKEFYGYSTILKYIIK